MKLNVRPTSTLGALLLVAGYLTLAGNLVPLARADEPAPPSADASPTPDGPTNTSAAEPVTQSPSTSSATAAESIATEPAQSGTAPAGSIADNTPSDASKSTQQLTSSTALIEALTAQNESLQRAVEALNAQLANNSLPPTTLAEPTPTPDGKEFVTLVPNSDGVIEMDLALFDSPSFGEVNPFVQRYQQKSSNRTLELRISSLARGPNSSVVLNNHLLGIGQTFEGFTLWSIEPDGIFLRRDAFLLNIPMMQKPVTIRMP
ncbi:MAG: hypothetical protein IPP19_10430 [Verrucomicrobia bacterium]|nr:hypothetical protein [Verrucomicrobiota bacterium]